MSVRREAVFLLGAGTVTALGTNHLAVAAAVRAGISGYAEHPFMLDRHGERMIVARVDWLDPTMPLAERLATLAAEAAGEALEPLAGARAWSRPRVHLALSTGCAADPSGVRAILQSLCSLRATALIEEDVTVVTEGHAGGILALENAVADLHAGRARVCLVGGVDSHMSADALEAIDYAGRLQSRSNRWGFTPGEGAGFCLLTTGAYAESLKLTPAVQIEAVATAKESNLLGARAVNIGEGLSTVFRATLSTEHRVAHSYCDLNGETYRADELAFAMCRTSDHFVNNATFTAAAQWWGDVGAASAPLAIALATGTWARGYRHGPAALVWASSAHAPLRGAARIRHVTTPEAW